VDDAGGITFEVAVNSVDLADSDPHVYPNLKSRNPKSQISYEV
jgi:hypothetical protein